MVAPAGVNEGLPQESAETELAGAEHAGAQVIETAPGGDVTDTAAAEPGPDEPDLAEAKRAEADHATADPTQADSEEADPEEAVPAQAEPALVQTGGAAGGEPGWGAEEEGRDVSPLAVVGIILGVIALVGVAVGVLVVLTHGFRPKTVVTYRSAAVFGLRPGQCVNSGTNALAITVLSCARSHDAEVFATFRLPVTGWPGASTVQLDASNGCASRLDSYLNPALAAAVLTQEYVYPNEAAWQAGERTVICEVRAVNGQLTGSVRAKG